jgi:hypothetical protein
MRLSKNRSVAVKNRIFVIALGWLGLAASMVGADSRPWVHMAVSGIVKGDSMERVLLCLSAKPRHPDDTIPVTFCYAPRIDPYAVVLTPVTISDFAVVGVWLYWDVNAAPGIGEKLQYVEAKWDTPHSIHV